MSLPRYHRYKDSGVDWIGEVPDHWNVTALKRGYVVTLVKMLQTDASGEQDELLPYLRAANIQWRGVDISDVKLMWFSQRDKSQLRLEQGDLLVSEGGDVGRSCLWMSELDECYIQNSVNRVRSHDGHSSRYLYYWMSTIKDKGYIDVLCNKSTIAHFTAEKVGAVPVPFPPKDEQKAISGFLDTETSRIDSLIAEQQRMIELLREKRQATISWGVIKGLNRSAPMKYSGIEWLGTVPEHWDVSMFIRYVRVTEGQVDPENDKYRNMVLIAPNHIEGSTGRLLMLETADDQNAESGKYLCPSDSVIYSKIRPALRKACLAPFECLCSADMYPLSPRSNLDARYLLWYLLSDSFSTIAVLESDRVAMPKINRETLKGLALLVPPLKEQIVIANHIDLETAKIDSLIAEANRSIGLMKERRSALISAAVTGQIDVRGLAETEAA